MTEAVVVAVDGSEPNRAALAWAIAEARRSGSPLLVACVAEKWQVTGPVPDGVSERDYVQPIADAAVARATEVLGADRVSAEVRQGLAATVLREIARDGRMLVVGKRGLGALGRILLGSTSIALAGRADVPIVVVPDDWDDAARPDAPIVAGVDLERSHTEVLVHALVEADRRQVGLDVLQIWEPYGPLSSDDQLNHEAFDEWRPTALTTLRIALDEARRVGAPDREIEIRVDQRIGHRAHELLLAGDDAQLLVLGRVRKDRISGFPLGSVARSVLHHAAVPVAIIPVGRS